MLLLLVDIWITKWVDTIGFENIVLTDIKTQKNLHVSQQTHISKVKHLTSHMRIITFVVWADHTAKQTHERIKAHDDWAKLGPVIEQ